MRLRILGEDILEKDLRKWSTDHLNDPTTWIRDIANALQDWYDDTETISLTTSGSTGKPKEITHTKAAMIASARLTGDFLGLLNGMSALSVLPSAFIAGKMMIYRALVLDLDLTCLEPKLDLSADILHRDMHFDFSAMTPLQVQTTIEKDASAMARIDQLIIGGAPISRHLMRKIKELSTQCYTTYGMTETITHVAMKGLNLEHASDHFTALKGVTFSVDQDCLTIDAEHLVGGAIKTTDIVEFIDNKRFNWLGRADHVINRGGVKLHPELIESKLAALISERFFVVGRSTEHAGAEPILIKEGESLSSLQIEKMHAELPKLWRPADVYMVKEIQETSTGKIIRDLDQYDLSN